MQQIISMMEYVFGKNVTVFEKDTEGENKPLNLWVYWKDKPNGVLLFKGRYNGSAVKSSGDCSLEKDKYM
ncbi:hypothetical protein [Photorhabdus viridis]|uniref:hypothetical protein n=1 Tax=Photorhabdus viridis TaxID=3163327 RepID=UPI003307B9C6